MRSPTKKEENSGFWRAGAVHALLLVALLALLFPPAFLRGEIVSPAEILYVSPPWSAYKPADFHRVENPLMSDIITLFYPMYYETERCLERGEWPLWNRLELGGMPLLANYETAIFYPPRLLYRIFDVPTAMSLHILVKLWLCGMTAFVCGNGLGLSRAATRFFSIGWMLATYNVMFAPWSLPDVSGWIPILFLGVHYIAEAQYRHGAIVATLGAVLLLFSGHPELAFSAALGIGLYFLLRLGVPWRGIGHVARAVGACVVFWGIALAATSVQTLPFLEYYFHSSQAHREDVVENAFFTAGNLVAYWVPRFYGLRADYTFWGNAATLDYSMIYPGIAVWVGIAGLLAVRGVWKRPIVVTLASASLIQLALVFQAPGFRLLNRLPLLDVMAPYWWAVFPIFAFPLLGAIGVDAWIRERPPFRRWIPSAATLAVGLAVVAFAFRFHQVIIEVMGVRDYVIHQVLIFVGFLAAGVIVVVVCAATNRYALAAPILTALLAADLLVAARGINPTAPRDHAYPQTALTQYLQNLPQPCRVGIAQAGLVSGSMAPYGIEEWLGYDGLYPERVLRFQTELGQFVWDNMEPACAIQYYLHDPLLSPQFPIDEPGRFTKVRTLDGLDVYRNNWALPHAYFARSVEVIGSPEVLFERMKHGEVHPIQTALVLKEDAPASLPLPADVSGTATIRTRTATRVEIDVETSRPQVLVLADAYFPGWEARIDGEPAEVFPVFYAFRGVVVPAGAHAVDYVYRPLSFYVPLVVSSAILILLLIAGARTLWRSPAPPCSAGRACRC